MKKIVLSAVLAAVAVGASAGTPIKYQGNTATVLCSQGFQGPEKWDAEVFPVDSKGYITIFDGKTFRGWRGYGLTGMPAKWKVEDGCIRLDSQAKGAGGDIIFAHKFKNFEVSIQWKISKGGNSGVFYLAQETTDANGNIQPIYVSCPECQVLDDENHPDAKAGVDGNHKSGSLYDMLPPKPFNAKPYGEWNTIVIRVENGHVTHIQNGVKVVEYDLWTPEWTAMLQKSKFAEKSWPLAFGFLNDCGGEQHEGLIGLQDHGNDVWFRNIKVKEL